MADSYVYIFRDGEGRPLYVGKGTNNRERHHAIQARRGSGLYWHRKLRKMLANNEPFTVERVVTGLSDEAAFALEKELIQKYGRKRYDEGGVLYNLDDGGRGASSEYMKQLWDDEDLRRRHLKAVRKVAQSPEWRAKIGEASRRAHQRPEVKQKQSARMKKQWAEDWRRESHSEQSKEWFSGPENKKKHSEALKKKNSESPEIVKRRAMSLRQKWQDDEYKQRMSAAIKKGWDESEGRRESVSAKMKAAWKDPEYLRKMQERPKPPKTGKTLTCKQCGSEFYALPARVKAGVKFCSMNCYSDSRANPKRSRRKVKHVC